MLGGMLEIATTPEGQMATAVLTVLLAWAVLTKRIYVIEVGTPFLWQEVLDLVGIAEIDHPEPKVQVEEIAEEEPPTKEETRQARRRWPVKPLKTTEIHEFSGYSPRDPTTRRLVGRQGAYWSEPDATGLKIRGPTYLMDKVKIPVGKPLFFLLDCDLFDLPKQTDHVGRYLKHRISSLWSDYGKPKGYTVIIQLQVPGPPWKSFVMYFGLTNPSTVFDNDTPFSRIAKKFFAPQNTTSTSGDQNLHKWRNNTFKLIPRCVNAPFVVKRAVGEVPTLLGNKLQQAYYGTSDYFEVDVNISSSRIAQYTVGLALNYAAVVVCDLAFVLQGASPAELPEQLVGCMRIEHIVMKDAQPLDLTNSSDD